MVERKNIENMIVNSKLWSPPFGGAVSQPPFHNQSISSQAGMSFGGGAAASVSNASMLGNNELCTTNVFKDKRDELTKILKKRLTYIHQ
jgi:hypothetical protein